MVDFSNQIITSASNPLLKQIRRSLTRGSLTDHGLMVTESIHLLREAMRSKLDIPTVVVAASARHVLDSYLSDLSTARLMVVSDVLFEKTVSTESSRGIMALVKPPVWDMDDLFFGQSFVVALDCIQDPGNAGAIMRSAEAFGGTGVIFLSGAVRPFNSKLSRASAGSVFRIPFVYGLDGDLACKVFRQKKVQILAAVPRARMQLRQYDLGHPTVLLIGSEGQGISKSFQRTARKVCIPTTSVESLNAATAAGILLYESACVRKEKSDDARF